MGRRKIEIKAIKDDRNRSVTFLKRKGGLFKKAHELSVLCSVDVAVIIFGHNKKLYEFSSGDINETIGRYQYYGGAHEHKGPEDFNGKKDGGDDDDDDDENMASPHPESHSPPEHPMIPQLHNQPPYQHIRHHTPSASPPMPNGAAFQPQRFASPQPMSRPQSRTHIRRSSSNLAPPQAHMHGSQPPQQPPPQSYAYMPNPPIYNPQAAAGIPVRGQPGPPGPPAQPNHPPQYQYTHPIPNPQVHQQFQDEQRRQSMPPNLPSQQEQRPPATSPPQQPSIHISQQPPQQPPQQQHNPPASRPEHSDFQSPPLPQPKALSVSAKNHSIFTPIDDSRSLLAQNWGPMPNESSARSEPQIKFENGPRSQSIDTASMGRPQTNGRAPPAPPMTMNGPTSNGPAPPQRTVSTSSVPIIQPPSRTDSMKNDPKRPKLNLQIPSEHSEGEGSATSSNKDNLNATMTPVRGPGEGGHSGVVLPPPSPSASALLSAGASGPPNPFARPAPPGSNAYGGRGGDNMETPISALPSRFLADQLLPSPSSFYNDWGFGRDSNMLPSPSNFQTPVVQSGPGFSVTDEGERKRKTSDGSDGGLGKRIKT